MTKDEVPIWSILQKNKENDECDLLAHIVLTTKKREKDLYIITTTKYNSHFKKVC
jgi:hypothetical protein